MQVASSQTDDSASGFQCSLVGVAVTFPRPSALHSASVIAPKPNFPLSAVDRRLSVRAFSRSSKLLSLLCGGVKGDCRALRGGSVGRRTAGTYKGDFGGRSCRVCAGRYGGGFDRGEVGEELLGVAVAELTGEIGCDWEL